MLQAAMRLILFRSESSSDLFGFTADSTGSNLPGDLGPWLKAGEGSPAQVYAGGSLDSLAPCDPVIKAVAKEGFYLARSGLTISNTMKPGQVR
jgi:hypothetical protein